MLFRDEEVVSKDMVSHSVEDNFFSSFAKD
ncbi:hypothetical protein TNCV_54191, partial [Trichonephila clavipes]